MKTFGALGAFFCFLAVTAGAVGSHALKDHLNVFFGLYGQLLLDICYL